MLFKKDGSGIAWNHWNPFDFVFPVRCAGYTTPPNLWIRLALCEAGGERNVNEERGRK
jgi:hypothetical protein